MVEEDMAGPHCVSLGVRPGRAYQKLQERIRERAYQRFLDRDGLEGDPEADWLAAEAELLSPVAVTIREQKKNLVVEAQLGGFSREEIEVQLAGNTLILLGAHQEPERADDRNRRRRKTPPPDYISFYHALTLPAEVDADGARAKLQKNGKLKVTLPRRSPAE